MQKNRGASLRRLFNSEARYGSPAVVLYDSYREQTSTRDHLNNALSKRKALAEKDPSLAKKLKGNDAWIVPAYVHF